MNRLLQIWNVMKGTKIWATLGASVMSTGVYVGYVDSHRYPRIIESFTTGKLLPPLAENNHEVKYFHRPELENTLRDVLQPTHTNQYYVIQGEVGTGKTRLLVELVREMEKENGRRKQGAPVYVLATQGKSFAESFASAINFRFDEHISWSFFLNYLLKIQAVPRRDDHNKLQRVLDAVEEAAFVYMKRTGKPAVIVLDGLDWLSHHMPGSLEKLQMKAKLWADTNIIKVIFVCNDEATCQIFQSNPSNWSRAANPIYIKDLSYAESLKFLTTHQLMEQASDNVKFPVEKHMSEQYAKKVIENVGGRLLLLLDFKRDYYRDIPFEKTLYSLTQKEKVKFDVSMKSKTILKLLASLTKAADKQIPLTQALGMASIDDLNLLTSKDILRFERAETGMLVKFESKLTETVIRNIFDEG